MKKIGLTGSIGSGKSTIAHILRCMGYPIYLSDNEASRLMNTHPLLREALQKRLGKDAYNSEGNLNKPIVAQIIFNDPQALQDINRLVHPRVIEDFQSWCQQQSSPCVFFESAIIVEANLTHFFDYIICVTASESIRLNRVTKRDGLQPEQIKERMRNQLDDTTKCLQANYIIYNDSQHRVIEQVLDMLKQINP